MESRNRPAARALQRVSYRIQALPSALIDIEQAASWYERQQIGLAATFVHSVEIAVDNVARDPLRPRLRERRRQIRWVLTRSFPYRIIYTVQSDVVIIIAVLHSARHDRHWRRRA